MYIYESHLHPTINQMVCLSARCDKPESILGICWNDHSSGGAISYIRLNTPIVLSDNITRIEIVTTENLNTYERASITLSLSHVKLEIGNKPTAFCLSQLDTQRIYIPNLREVEHTNEYFPDRYGNNRKLYSKTFVFATPDPENIYGVILNTHIHALPISIVGYINGQLINSSNFWPSDPNSKSSTLMCGRVNNYDIGELLVGISVRGGQAIEKDIPCAITIKYIKI